MKITAQIIQARRRKGELANKMRTLIIQGDVTISEVASLCGVHEGQIRKVMEHREANYPSSPTMLLIIDKIEKHQKQAQAAL